MTAQDIIDTALSLSAEDPQYYQNKDICIKWLNMVLAESMPAENRIRQRQGRQLLTEPVNISRLNDSVEMDLFLCRFCIPMGLAAYVYTDKEEEYFYTVYRQRFLESLQKAAGAQEMRITDCYGPEVV